MNSRRYTISMKSLCLCFVLVSACCFAGVTVQNGEVSADFNSQPLRQILDTIKQETNIKIVMDDSVASTPVSAKFENLPVASAIRKMLEGTGINYIVLTDADGSPDRLLISGSEKPGSAPKRLDTRPLSPAGRGVVAPVVLPPAVPMPGQVINPNPGQKQAPGLQKKMDMNSTIPTAGGAGTPNQNNNNQTPNNNNPNMNQGNNQHHPNQQPQVNNNNSDEDDDESDDSSDEDYDSEN